MNYWAGRSVMLRLTERGKGALTGILRGQDEEVFVQWADELGLWILVEVQDEARVRVVLVKWEHFETAMMNVVIEEPQSPKVIGFGDWRARNQF